MDYEWIYKEPECYQKFLLVRLRAFNFTKPEPIRKQPQFTDSFYTIRYPLTKNVSMFETEGSAISYARSLLDLWIPFTLYDTTNGIVAHLSYRDSKLKSIPDENQKWVVSLAPKNDTHLRTSVYNDYTSCCSTIAQ